MAQYRKKPVVIEALYRKKPVVIEAFRLGEAWPEWWADAVAVGTAKPTTFNKNGDGPDSAQIETLFGTYRAERGDWIIRDTKGNLQRCRADFFALIYEAVT